MRNYPHICYRYFRYSALGTVICEKPRADRIIGNSNDCYFDGSEAYDSVIYNGSLSVTINENPCVNWLSRSGKICDDYACQNHNYCRKFPKIEGHWCYVDYSKNIDGWENCEVPVCSLYDTGIYQRWVLKIVFHNFEC